MIRWRWMVLLAMLAGTVSCSSLMVDPLEQLRAANKLNLAKVTPGMTRFETETVMGNASAGGGLPEVVFGRVQYLQAKNPMREEAAKGTDGAEYLVLFYYTDVKKLDDKITDDELTPVVFRDGKVAGIGYPYLAQRLSKYREFAQP